MKLPSRLIPSSNRLCIVMLGALFILVASVIPASAAWWYSNTPSITSPTSASTVSNKPTFSWTSVRNASSYRLDVTTPNDTKFRSKKFVGIIHGTSTSFSLANGSYIVRVVGLNSGGWQISEFSKVVSFKVGAVTGGPDPVPTQPTTPPTQPTTPPTQPTTPPTQGTQPPATNGAFPTADTTGVPSNVTLKAWPSTDFSSDGVTGTSQTIDGVTYKVIEGYTITVPTSTRFDVRGNVLFKNDRFIGNGTRSPGNDAGAALVSAGGSATMRFEHVDILANGYSRGIQSDTAHIIVNASKFINTTNAGVEKNDRNMKSDFTFTNNFVTSDCSWTTRDPGSHTDGIQWGGARNVVVKNNTILINICADHVSNSAIGGWAELGNVNSSVIDHNLLSGGGKTVYMQSKDNFTWGSASFTNNVFDRKWSGGGTGCGTAAGSQPGLWGGLYGSGLPKSLVWSGNTYENGASVTISQATGC